MDSFHLLCSSCVRWFGYLAKELVLMGLGLGVLAASLGIGAFAGVGLMNG